MRAGPSRRGRLLAAVVAVLAAAGALTGLLTLLPTPSPAAPTRPVAAAPTGTATGQATTTATAPGTTAAATPTGTGRAPAPATVPVPAGALPASRPVALTVPAIGVHSPPVTSLGLDAHRALQVPGDAATAGWFTGSPTPGRPGPSVMAGHVNYNGVAGVFGRLGELRAGERATVTRADGIRAVFTIYRVEHYRKTAFPTRRVYGDTPGPELRLITCGGGYDAAHRSYVDNIVVYARMTGAYRLAGR